MHDLGEGLSFPLLVCRCVGKKQEGGQERFFVLVLFSRTRYAGSRSKGNQTHSNSDSDSFLPNQDGCDGDDDEVDDVLGTGEEGGDDSGSSFDHEMGDGRREPFEEREEVEDAWHDTSGRSALPSFRSKLSLAARENIYSPVPLVLKIKILHPASSTSILLSILHMPGSQTTQGLLPVPFL